MNIERIYLNCDVITMNDAAPSARAFATGGGRFLAVGSEDEIRALAGEGAEMVDLGGAVVVPGFIETHNHLSMLSLSQLMADCGPIKNANMDEVLKSIAEHAAALPPDMWVTGWGLDDSFNENFRHLNRRDLDSVSAERPILIYNASGHLAYANGRALAIGGIDADTPQPHGGHIDKDESGEPTGLLREPGAIYLVSNHAPKPPEDIYEHVLPLGAAMFNEVGITSAHDGGVGVMGHGGMVTRAYRSLAGRGRLPLRVYLTTVEEAYRPLAEAGFGPTFGCEWVKLGAVKFWQDGSIQGNTAALIEPYTNLPDFYGDLIMDQDELDALTEKYQALGMQMALHANGDRAMESVLSSLERAREKHPRDNLRHMIIHAQTAHEEHIARMKELGAIPSYFIMHVHYWGDRHRDLFLGPERGQRIDPLGSSLRQGLPFALHCDSPVTPPSPLFGIYCAVNRLTSSGQVLGPDQRVSPLDALRGYTTWAAMCSFEEDIKGSIEPGKLADFAVLSDSPLNCEPVAIKDIKVLRTVVGDRQVYPAP